MLISHVMVTVPSVVVMVGDLVVTYVRAFYSLATIINKRVGRRRGLGGQAGTDGPVELRL